MDDKVGKPRPPGWSAKVAGIREWWQREHPESGGAPALSLVDELKLLLMAAGDSGVLLADLNRSMGSIGRERREEALKHLRAEESVEEARERRPDAAGHVRSQVVLRLRQSP